jgi:hypothetical protein
MKTSYSARLTLAMTAGLLAHSFIFDKSANFKSEGYAMYFKEGEYTDSRGRKYKREKNGQIKRMN